MTSRTMNAPMPTRMDRRRFGITRNKKSAPLPGMTSRTLTIALPIAAAAYARSGLSTLQHLLVPKGLRASGLAAEAALAGYGVIQGMALPVVLFPSCVMLAAAELIVPKLTEKQVRKDREGVLGTSHAILMKGLRYSAICAAMFIALGDRFSMALYASQDAGGYIRLFALIVPVMYMDMLTDGCLKGLGEMMFCMYINIADAGLSALMVWLLLPRWGLPAYIFTICFTEIFNFALSLWRLKKITGLSLPPGKTAFIVLWSALSAGIAWFFDQTISAGNGVPALVLSVILGLAVYVWGSLSPSWGAQEEAGRPASG